jgi:diacylglycerol kinase family enzyme
MISSPTPPSAPHRARRQQANVDRDIVLLCNPRAGGRWKELAAILDSPEAKFARWIVTDSIDDIGPALADLGPETRLLCIYGGDGTIQRILDAMYADRSDGPLLAFIGGGTMNVTSRWCGMMSSTPAQNFRDVVQAYKTGSAMWKEVPLLEVHCGADVYRGFTFGIGPVVRILNEYETGTKGAVAALGIVAKAIAAVWTRRPFDFLHVLKPMEAEIRFDGQPLPYSHFEVVFCNITGQIHIGVEPYNKVRSRDTFHAAAYAISDRELALLLPFLIRGRLPVDPKSLMTPVDTWKQIALSYLGKGAFPNDPRYVNEVIHRFEVRTNDETYFTVDGEIVPMPRGEPVTVNLGPVLRLAVSPTLQHIAPVIRKVAGM